MTSTEIFDPTTFSEILYQKMKQINLGVGELELYEFRYGLACLFPENGGWASVKTESMDDIVKKLQMSDFYKSIQIKPRRDGELVLDATIHQLTNMLFVGLVTGDYPETWIKEHFYFDVRGFFFLHRTEYLTAKVLEHLGGKPFRQFEPKQKSFERCQGVGYKSFMAANLETDLFFIKSVQKLIDARGTPCILAIAGPTAAGKTEIVERLHAAFSQAGKKTTSIEMDNFLTDRDEREAKGIDSLGKAAIHFELFQKDLAQIIQGKKISTPRYNFIDGSSSHHLDGSLKPGRIPVEIEPADIIFIEGNFPFLLKEVIHLIGIKVVYLTDDDVRFKRKWKRDMDYRMKYHLNYFRNRYFKDQYLMAETCFIPQMEVCDMLIHTTGAAIWVTPEFAALLDKEFNQ
jgi:uridine kinase